LGSGSNWLIIFPPAQGGGKKEKISTILKHGQNYGEEDILIACVDGLTGFTEAISAIYPKTEIQKCIIHQIRNSIVI
jgi:transposase-like protein